jgi:putative ABC transport system substrate-binding protein
MSETRSAQTSRIEALREGLRDRGYVEGKNIATELRSADGNYDRLPELAAELVSLKVAVIVAFGTKAVSAAQRATTTIPIVDPVMGDPVALGLSKSLARPGRNITGSTQYGPEIAAKRIELLKEAIPYLARVTVLINPANAGSGMQVGVMRATTEALKLELRVLEVRSPNEFKQAISRIPKGHAEALLVTSDTLFRLNAAEIVNLAATRQLPLAGPREFAALGGLIGYGPDALELYRHAAYFVDRILNGAKPDDLPIEQPTKLGLVINLKTAKALGLTIPQSLLLRADELIQ